MEELVRRFETRIAIAALGASATAMAVARNFLGDGPEFEVFPLPYPSSAAHILFFTLGAVAGLAAVAYNKTILSAINLSDKLKAWPVELRAAVIGGIVGLLVWFTPDFVGGGESLTQQTLSGTLTFGTLAAVFALRFGLGAVSYAAKTPGGLFAPMLVLGSTRPLVRRRLPVCSAKPRRPARSPRRRRHGRFLHRRRPCARHRHRVTDRNDRQPPDAPPNARRMLRRYADPHTSPQRPHLRIPPQSRRRARFPAPSPLLGRAGEG